jgi:acetylornithine deacetylase/succinyl-diaminopimelate desuccinylase-like protein
VPDQNPYGIFAKLRRHLDEAGFADVETEMLSAEHPARVDPGHPFSRLAIATAEDVYGKPPSVWPMVGSSGPMYPFVHTLRLPIATPGVGYAHSRIHSPNENIRLKDFASGTKFTARLIDRFARMRAT